MLTRRITMVYRGGAYLEPIAGQMFLWASSCSYGMRRPPLFTYRWTIVCCYPTRSFSPLYKVYQHTKPFNSWTQFLTVLGMFWAVFDSWTILAQSFAGAVFHSWALVTRGHTSGACSVSLNFWCSIIWVTTRDDIDIAAPRPSTTCGLPAPTMSTAIK